MYVFSPLIRHSKWPKITDGEKWENKHSWALDKEMMARVHQETVGFWYLVEISFNAAKLKSIRIMLKSVGHFGHDCRYLIINCGCPFLKNRGSIRKVWWSHKSRGLPKDALSCLMDVPIGRIGYWLFFGASPSWCYILWFYWCFLGDQDWREDIWDLDKQIQEFRPRMLSKLSRIVSQVLS